MIMLSFFLNQTFSEKKIGTWIVKVFVINIEMRIMGIVRQSVCFYDVGSIHSNVIFIEHKRI